VVRQLRPLGDAKPLRPLGDEQERLAAEILVGGQRAPPIRPSPLQCNRLSLLPPFALAAVEEDLDPLDFSIVLRHVAPEVQLLPGHDDEAPRTGGPPAFPRRAGRKGRLVGCWVGGCWGILCGPHFLPLKLESGSAPWQFRC
jgi:hypothetical protein